MHIKLDQSEAAAKNIADHIQGGEVFALIGPLGSGKTTLVKHLAKQLHYKKNVTSPTFSLCNIYKAQHPHTKKPLFIQHLDVYRLNNETELLQSGLAENWGEPNSITCIEWADKIKNILPPHTIFIHCNSL